MIRSDSAYDPAAGWPPAREANLGPRVHVLAAGHGVEIEPADGPRSYEISVATPDGVAWYGDMATEMIAPEKCLNTPRWETVCVLTPQSGMLWIGDAECMTDAAMCGMTHAGGLGVPVEAGMPIAVMVAFADVGLFGERPVALRLERAQAEALAA
jgi:hypothetical protein